MSHTEALERGQREVQPLVRVARLIEHGREGRATDWGLERPPQPDTQFCARDTT